VLIECGTDTLLSLEIAFAGFGMRVHVPLGSLILMVLNRNIEKEVIGSQRVGTATVAKTILSSKTIGFRLELLMLLRWQDQGQPHCRCMHEACYLGFPRLLSPLAQLDLA
jgi:hypothetical protein